ncbi:MAG: ATP synthase F0 subunit B [Lachnospiraceae bacterium]|nr:ATP synthase F0 subunit B [Lachnospiraceae bacterium]
MGIVSIHPVSIAITIANVLILFLILKKFLFAPVDKILEERAKKIVQNKENAEKSAAEADELKRKYDEKLSELEQTEKTRLSEANRKAAEEYDRIISDANKRADQIIEDAGRKADMAAAVRDAEQERKIADIVAAAAKKIAAANNSAETDKSLIEEFLSKAGEEDGR